MANTRIRRLVSYVTPENAQKVLNHDRYWHTEILALLFERCDQLRFTHPELALNQARYLPELASRIPIRTTDQPQCEGSFPSRAAQATWEVRSLSLLGYLLSSPKRPPEAEDAFQAASRILVSEPVAPSVLAQFFLYRGRMRVASGEPEAARADFRQATRQLCEQRTRQVQAEAWILLAKSSFSDEATVAVAEQVDCLRYSDKRSTFLFSTAIRCLAVALEREKLSITACQQVARCLAKTRQHKQYKNRPREKALLVWLEGKALVQMGFDALALRRMSRAWDVFRRLRVPEQILLSGRDLAKLLKNLGHTDEAAIVLHDSAGQALRSCGDREILREILKPSKM